MNKGILCLQKNAQNTELRYHKTNLKVQKHTKSVYVYTYTQLLSSILMNILWIYDSMDSMDNRFCGSIYG